MAQEIGSVAWIEHLPNAGGDWGRGIVGTVRQLSNDIDSMELQKMTLDEELAELKKKQADELDELKARHAVEKAQLSEAIKSRKSLVASTVKRAEKEAPQLYANLQIANAKAAGNGEAEPEIEVAAP